LFEILQLGLRLCDNDFQFGQEHIEVKPAPEVFGFKITLHGKRHLVNAPLVSAVDVNLFPDKIERG
jgi:hypothetical protein